MPEILLSVSFEMAELLTLMPSFSNLQDVKAAIGTKITINKRRNNSPHKVF